MQNNTGNKEDLDRFSAYMMQRLEEHRMPVDDACWKEIDKKISPKRPVWGWWAGSVAAAACLLWLLPTFKEIPVESLKIAETETANQIKKATLQEDSQLIKPVERIKVEKKTMPSIILADWIQIRPDEEIVVLSLDSLFMEEKDSISPVAETATTIKIKKKYYPEPASSSKISSSHPIEKVKTSGSWLIAAAVGTQRNVALPNLGSDDLYYAPEETPSGGGSFLDPILPNPPAMNILTPNDFTYAAYSVPVTVGLLVRKNLNNRIGVESGIEYTYLSSRFRQDGIMQAKARLELHYLGIPVNLTVNLWDKSRWNIYFSGGLKVEKGLKSVYNVEQYKENAFLHHSDKQSINGLQGSMNAAVGVSYRFYKELSLYAEPHLSYFFDNKQPISSRTDKPLGFGISAGIRFEIK